MQASRCAGALWPVRNPIRLTRSLDAFSADALHHEAAIGVCSIRAAAARNAQIRAWPLHVVNPAPSLLPFVGFAFLVSAMSSANEMDKALGALQQRNFVEAEERARTILKRERRNARALEVLAEALLGLGRAEEVLVELQKRQSDKGNPVFLTLLGRANLDLGRVAEAESPLREATLAVPCYAPAYVALSEALAAAGRLSEAVTVLDSGVVLLPRHPGLSFALARLLAESGELRASRAVCERLYRGAPQWPGAALLLARVLESLGETEAARGVLRDFVGRQSFNPIARISLARLSLTEGDLDAAIRGLREVTRSAPELTGQAVLTLAESPNGRLHLRVSNAVAGLTG